MIEVVSAAASAAFAHGLLHEIIIDYTYLYTFFSKCENKLLHNKEVHLVRSNQVGKVNFLDDVVGF